jgi:hypothetical protein
LVPLDPDQIFFESWMQISDIPTLFFGHSGGRSLDHRMRHAVQR